jgi:hypothetical protein
MNQTNIKNWLDNFYHIPMQSKMQHELVFKANVLDHV